MLAPVNLFIHKKACLAVAVRVTAFILLPLVASAQLPAGEGSYIERQEVQAFIDEQVGGGAEREQLESMFAQLLPDPKVLDLMEQAPERKSTWPQYRKIFISPKRIHKGAEFIRTHSELLHRAEEEYGVPGKIIAAIMGVETYYGDIKGKMQVARSLATLAFDYTRRSVFFRRELAAFLQLSREQGFAPLSLQGSYAGAMGYPQFMPSSYLSYAVDFNADGVIDIWHSPTDAIASIANYLRQAGDWQPGREMIEQVEPLDVAAFANFAQGTLRPEITAAQLVSLGVTALHLPQDKKFKLIVVDSPAGTGEQYWVGGQNFYAVTRYNINTYYAMVVSQLADLIEQKVASATRKDAPIQVETQ